MNLNVGDKAYIKDINCNYDLKVHLLEQGLVKDTRVLITLKKRDLIAISYRGSIVVLSSNIAYNIEVYDSPNW